MAENSAPTLAPDKPAQDILDVLPDSPAASVSSEKEVLFDSIAHDDISPVNESENSAINAFFTGVLWFGYAIAIVVALVLVWSAANGLLKSLPR